MSLLQRDEAPPDRRILFPFLGSVLSERSLEATLRLADAQNATLIPAYLAIIPKALSIEAPLGAECEGALALLELVEQRAARAGVAVDSRIERGRTARHALARPDRPGALRRDRAPGSDRLLGRLLAGRHRLGAGVGAGRGACAAT